MTTAVQPRASGVPRGVLMGAAALVAFVLVAVSFGRDTGVGRTAMPAEAPVATLHLTFTDADDGGVVIRDAATGAVIHRVLPGTNGFLRSALRGFAHERMRDGLGAALPFTLTRWRDGTLSLQDEAIGRRIDLDAFGATQSRDFASLFSAKEAVK